MAEYLALEKLKEIELGILDYVDGICRKNGLKYFLAAGTLIGAVRHKGFIPWDDDIDIFMKREDYEKFIELTKDKNEKYLTMSLSNTKGYYYPFVKVVDTSLRVKEDRKKIIPLYGVWVDIFPLDYYDEKKNDYTKFAILNNKLSISIQDSFYTTGKFFKTFVKFFAYQFLKRKNPIDYAIKIDALSQIVKEKTDKLFIGLSPAGKKDLFDASLFDEVTDLEFEGKKYMAPLEYDKILTHRYGDYMKLPPESERVLRHGISVVKGNGDTNE